MSPEMLRIVLAAVLVMHGIGHVLFLGPALRVVEWADQTGGSWLLTSSLGDGVAHATGAVLWAVSIVLFVGSGIGLLATQDWWRTLAIGGAVVSLIGIALFWDGIASASAGPALVLDAAVLVALLVLHWPSSQAVGA